MFTPIARYGNVRKTDADLVLGIIEGIFARICVSLPVACVGVDEEAAGLLCGLLRQLNDGINLLQQDEMIATWRQTLLVISGNKSTAPIIGGYTTRLLNDARVLSSDELMQHFSFAMSIATAPLIAASWLEGFLKGSGTLLLLDEGLWQVVDTWIAGLAEDVFIQVLPLLRRTFANFSPPERRKIGEKAKSGGSAGQASAAIGDLTVDPARGSKGLPVIMELLGLTTKVIADGN